MKVYLVVGDNYEGSSLGGLYYDKDVAQLEADRRNKFKDVWDKHSEYSVSERDILDKYEKHYKEDELMVHIEGYMLSEDGEDIEIEVLVGRDWCKNKFRWLGECISVDIYSRATEEDFDLSNEELREKYMYLWEEVDKTVKGLMSNGMSIEDITDKLQEQYS